MGNTQIIKHTKQNKHNVIISERSHLPGAKFVEMFTFDCGNTVPIYELTSYHALNQFIGYAKFINKDYGNVYCRGEAHLHKSLYPSLYRDFTNSISKAGEAINAIINAFLEDSQMINELKLKKLNSKLSYYIIEGMLQHYGVSTRFVDIVDNHWIALWMGLNKAIEIKQIDKYFSYIKREIPFGVNWDNQDAQKELYQYILLISVPSLPVSHNGVYSSKEYVMIDLRQALPSYFLRPHAQHGLVVKKRSINNTDMSQFDLADSVVGILKIRIDISNGWLGNGQLLKQDNLFPPPAFDHGYDLLLQKQNIFRGSKYSIAKYV